MADPNTNPKTLNGAFVQELVPAPDVMQAFDALQNHPGRLLLDSSMQIETSAGKPLGRYSFLMADPFDWAIEPTGTANPLESIRKTLTNFECETIPDLPPMQGGWAGVLSYDLNRSFENISPVEFDEFSIPAIALGCYDVVIAWDHQRNRAWIISQGFPETEREARAARARARGEECLSWLSGSAHAKHKKRSSTDRTATCSERFAPQYSAAGPEGLTSNFSRDQYIDAVERSIEYIRSGDVFQINLAQRLLHRANCSSSELYHRLRSCNPAPFSGYFDFPTSKQTDASAAQIVSASPERFISIHDGVVETRPIKGTRRRTGTPMVDIHSRRQLLASEKDQAENTMIVDLMRNDLSRVCEDDSIRVTQLCELEQYQSVLHLVSAVEGKLKPNKNAIDLIEAVFPGGSITGAPKVRAMEIIAEIEPTSRGAYCGSLGYLGFDGNADLNILIRSVTAKDGWWQIPVGGGIVVQSDPVLEYEETWTKAAGMLRAINMKAPANQT